MKAEDLTAHNYHSLEANQAFLSNSQLKSFFDCPARTVAEINGQWDTGPKKAFLIGGYIDCMLLTPTDGPTWWNDHLSAMIEVGLCSKAQKTLGAKLAELKHADHMIEKALSDPLFMSMLAGDNQMTLTAELFGVPFRIMVDSIDIEKKRITDLKTTKDMNKEGWFNHDGIFETIEGTADLHRWRGRYYDEYRYFLQFSIYQQVAAIATNTNPDDWALFMATLNKKKPGDINPLLPEYKFVDMEIRQMNDTEALMRELRIVEQRLPQIMKWKTGSEPPPLCGKCSFCCAHKELQIIETKSVVWSDVT